MESRQYTVPELREDLKKNFGHDDFRPYQAEIVTQVMAGQDTLGVLPTGAGKSLCYQLPALLMPGATLVVSPLIALMQDQLDNLPPAVYSRATLINSSLSLAEIRERLAGIESGQYTLLYAAPERLRQHGFLSLLQRINISLVVVDEAHCVSVWGHDFRPDYLFIRKAVEMLEQTERPPVVLALTATATPEMQTEIAGQLGRELKTVSAPIFRPNLRLEVFSCANAEEKMRRLARVCEETPGAGIVYANSRERCEQLALFLKRQGIPASFYHAGLDPAARRETQEQFMLGRTRVMVATVAFGMGVDKSNVRMVAHFTMPESIEAYVQEAGRAGRDGKPARCVLLFAPSDKANLARWLKQNRVTLAHVRSTYRALKAHMAGEGGPIRIEELQAAVFAGEASDPSQSTLVRVAVSMLERAGLVTRQLESGTTLRIEVPPAPPGGRAELDALLAHREKQEERRLAEMLGYAQTSRCRHAVLAAHFEQQMAPCGTSCDCCLGTAGDEPEERQSAPTALEVPDIGRTALECVLSLPYPLGRAGLARVLRGAPDSPIQAGRCENFGRLKGLTSAATVRFLDELIARDLLSVDREADYPVLSITQNGIRVMEEEGPVLPNPVRQAAKARSSRGERKADGAAPAPAEFISDGADDRFERLRAWRRIEAERAKLPPYVVFHDSTLRAIAEAEPHSLDALAGITGIGPKKIELYGEAVLEVVRETTSAA